MDPPPSSSPSSSDAGIPMVAVTIIGILATLVVLASYYAFVTRCQLLRFLSSRRPWRQRRQNTPPVVRAVTNDSKGLGLPLIHMIPIVKFSRMDDGCDVVATRISVSECAVCLCEFQERERVRLLPNCSHAFHIDCIDIWLQGNTKCPFCRSDITLPLELPPASNDSHHDHQELNTSIVIDVRGDHETWSYSHTPRREAVGRRSRKMESLGDEAIDTRKKDEQFIVQPMRRSLSMGSSNHKQLYLSIQEFLREKKNSVLDAGQHGEDGSGDSWSGVRQSCFKFRQGQI